MKYFGKNVNIKKRDEDLSEKEIFINLIQTLDDCWKRTNILENEIDLGISSYEEPFYVIIENLIFLHYEDWKAEIILWWVFERLDEEKNLMPINVTLHQIKEDIESEDTSSNYLVENPEQLWDLIEKIENFKKL